MYQLISHSYKIYEQNYRNCLDEIIDKNFTKTNVKECVGVNYSKIMNFNYYEKMKVFSEIDIEMKEIILGICYEEALTNEVWANGCDLFQKDALDLVWAELNYYQTLQENEQKYKSIFTNIPPECFNKMISRVKRNYYAYTELLEEIDVH